MLLGLRVEGPGAGQILNDVTDRFLNRDLVGRTAALDLTREHLPYLGNEVVIAGQAGFLGAEGLGSSVIARVKLP